jgi:hypothetical protein
VRPKPGIHRNQEEQFSNEVQAVDNSGVPRSAVALVAGETMANPQAKDSDALYEHQPSLKQERERRTQPRSNGVLARIEDTTYEILRKHEKQSA